MEKSLAVSPSTVGESIRLSACGGKGEEPTQKEDAKTEAVDDKGSKKENDSEKESNTASDEAQAFIDSITVENAEFKGVCGPDAMWFYKDNVMVIKGTGEVINYTWETEELHDQGMDIYWLIVDEGITSLSRGENFFWENHTQNNLSKVILPATLTGIGHYVFKDCEYLTSITIPDSVTYIGELAFHVGSFW